MADEFAKIYQQYIFLAIGFFVATVPLRPAFSEEDPSDTTCLECHATDQPVVDKKVLQGSVHDGLNCIDCHKDVLEIPHPEKLGKVECSACHEKVFLEYKQSIHGQLDGQNPNDMPKCSDCHGTHGIYSPQDLRSLANHLKVDQLCLGCHASQVVIDAHPSLPSSEFINKYQQSVHGRGVHIKGLLVSATCTDCH